MPPVSRWCDPGAAMLEPGTHRLGRALLEAVAKGSPDVVAAMVSRLRGRGHSCREIAGFLGPRPSCPARLQAPSDRIALFASLEPRS